MTLGKRSCFSSQQSLPQLTFNTQKPAKRCWTQQTRRLENRSRAMEEVGNQIGFEIDDLIPSWFSDVHGVPSDGGPVEFETIADYLSDGKKTNPAEVLEEGNAHPPDDYTFQGDGHELDRLFSTAQSEDTLCPDENSTSLELDSKEQGAKIESLLLIPPYADGKHQICDSRDPPLQIEVTSDSKLNSPNHLHAAPAVAISHGAPNPVSQSDLREPVLCQLTDRMESVDLVLPTITDGMSKATSGGIVPACAQSTDHTHNTRSARGFSKSYAIAAQVALNRISSGNSNASDRPNMNSSSSIEETTTDSAQPKMRYSEGASASNYCHVCGRASNTIELAACANTRIGLCRKVMCDKCLLLHQRASFYHAKEPESSWTCMHCRNICPKRARCHQYQKNNLRRRLRKESAAAAAAVATVPTTECHSDVTNGDVKKQKKGQKRPVPKSAREELGVPGSKLAKTATTFHRANPATLSAAPLDYVQRRVQRPNPENYVTVPLTTSQIDHRDFKSVSVRYIPYHAQPTRCTREDSNLNPQQGLLVDRHGELCRIKNDKGLNSISPAGVGDAVFESVEGVQRVVSCNEITQHDNSGT